MLRVYHSNQLDVLEALMEYIVEQDPLDDPFEPEVVLVQSTGMAQWLQMTLANKFGIAANIAFPLPASFIWDMFVRVLPGIPKESAFSKQSMSWKLMTLLPGMLEEDDFAMLRHYLSVSSFSSARELRISTISIWSTARSGLPAGKPGSGWTGWTMRKPGRRRYGGRWWSIRNSLGSRTGTVPISTSVLSIR